MSLADTAGISPARSFHTISVKGRPRRVPAVDVDGTLVVVRGALVRVAEVFDEYWLQADALPDPPSLLRLLAQHPRRPDVFTFAQRVPDSHPHFPFRHIWDNVAVIPVTSYETWFGQQISSASRRNVRASEKRGLLVRSAPFDEAYVRGIMDIYNESPVRHGRSYWHYGKPFERVQAENGTYRDRSTFLAAYLGDEFVGYTKIVWDKAQGAIMQIVSKMRHFDRRPNNALLAAAVRLCAERGADRLLYEKFVYGDDVDSSLTRFKQSNGFVRVDVPRYYVPLTARGRAWLGLGLHREWKQRIPKGLRRRLLDLRTQLCASRGAALERREGTE